MESNKIVTIVLSVILALVVIIAIILYSSSQSQVSNLNSQLQTSQSQITNLQSQLRQASLNVNSSASIFDSDFHDLLQAHTFLLTETARRSPSNVASNAAFNASLAQLQHNINEVGALLTPIYGSNSQQLVNLWNQKANIFINYSTSVQNNDPNAMVYYNAAVASYIPQVVTFWTTTSNSYPILDQATAMQLATQHMTDVKTTIDAWLAGNYTLYYNDLEAAYFQIGTYADTIAQGIIQQNPQNFQ